jgi:putative transposase
MRSYTVRLKTTERQDASLSQLLAQLCELYNMALQQRRDVWRSHRKSIGYYEQQKQLTELRGGVAEYAAFPALIQRDPLRRVQRAFDGFFRRSKSGETPGYPRFRSSERYDSFTVDGQSFRIEGRTVIVMKLGGFRLKTRCRIHGTPKELRVKRCGHKWSAQVVCDIGPAPEKIAVRNAVGIDLGLTALATLSDGFEIPNPRWTRREENRLAAANQSLARKRRCSKNRAKARERLRRVHQRIAGLRSSYLHGETRRLIDAYDLIAYEGLKIRRMAQSNLAKSIMDAAWGQLIRQLVYKAECAGKYAVAVNPYGTTQSCSGCGEKVPKKLWQRHHACPGCNLSLGRDHNAALNIKALGESAVETQNVSSREQSPYL